MVNFASAAQLLPYLQNTWSLIWFVSGLAAILIPIITWNVKRGIFYNSYGQYLYQQDYYELQKLYYEQQRENNNKNDDYYNYGNDGNNYNYDNGSGYKDCSWINWPCRLHQWKLATYNNQDNNGERVKQNVPAWYIFLGGETEEMERWENDNGQQGQPARVSAAGASLSFAYLLTMVLFVGLLIFGVMAIAKKEKMGQLKVALIVMVIISFMNIITSVNTISTRDEDLNESYYGWYGQVGVLLVYADFWIMVFSAAFLVVFEAKNAFARKKYEKEADSSDLDRKGDYHAPTDA